ncbi:hypothetical protein ACQKMW_28485, partial [Pseudomonas sivasensis]
MKQYSFNITATTLEEFKKFLPTHKSKKILKNYLLNEYELPEVLNSLQDRAETEKVIQPYWMNEAEINKLELLVKQAKLKGVNINHSSIMRDIMKNLVERYRNNPIQKSEYSRQTFKVPVGTKTKLASLIE